MSLTVLFAADFQLFAERARGRGNNIAAQNTKALHYLLSILRPKALGRFAIIVFAEFTETNRARHRNSRQEVAEEGGQGSSTRALAVGLLALGVWFTLSIRAIDARALLGRNSCYSHFERTKRQGAEEEKAFVPCSLVEFPLMLRKLSLASKEFSSRQLRILD